VYLAGVNASDIVSSPMLLLPNKKSRLAVTV
jgi:hypothetical protein